MRFGLILIVVLLLSAAFWGCKNQEAEEMEREILAQQGEVVQNGSGETVTEDQPSGEVIAEELAAGEEYANEGAVRQGQNERSEPGVTPDPGAIPDAGAIPPEVVAEVKELPQAPLGAGYEVQISAGTDRADAAIVVETYQKRGYQPYVSTLVVDGQEVFRVRLGVFATYGEAEKVRRELTEKFSIEPWIAPVP